MRDIPILRIRRCCDLRQHRKHDCKANHCHQYFCYVLSFHVYSHLSGSQLFDINAYVTAKNLCAQFPGLQCDYEDKTKIRIFGELNDYWFAQYNKMVFDSQKK